MRPHLAEQELLLQHVLPRIQQLAVIRATPLQIVGEHPQTGEWKRELQFRREYAAVQADHDRIRELEAMIAGEKVYKPNAADPAKIAEIALVLSDSSLRGWLSKSEELRNADLRELLKVARLDLKGKEVADVDWLDVR
jgi:hypothetical protein